MDISRISIDATRDVHNVLYTTDGTAYCDTTKSHQHKTGEGHWPKRSENGYIVFWDKYLGFSVSHKVAVKKGETYSAFWTRIRLAENRGHIDTIGTSCFSDKNAEILKKELGVAPERQIMDEGSLVGSSYVENGKTVFPHGKSVTCGTGKEKGILAGASVAVIAVIFAIGYLIFARGK